MPMANDPVVLAFNLNLTLMLVKAIEVLMAHRAIG